MGEHDLRPGLHRAIEVVKKFRADYRLAHDTRKRFDITAMQRVVDNGLAFIVEDLEAELGLREHWALAATPDHPQQNQDQGGAS